MDNTMMFVKKVLKYLILLCSVFGCVLIIVTFTQIGDNKARLNEIFLAQPAFAQQATTFPSDEAGISAYVNVGQTIDLAKAKTSMRGIQAESDNYIIGIMELPGLPEEEFPHMYVSSDGWILAYYSKFAPAARIFQWYGYEGGTITTTTLQDAIAKICPTIGVNFAQVRGNMTYYHFAYPEATKMTVAVERIAKDGSSTQTDTLTYSIPYDVTLYEGSWSYTAYEDTVYFTSRLSIDGTRVGSMSNTGFICDYFEDQYITSGSLHTIELYARDISSGEWTGVAVVFIY